MSGALSILGGLAQLFSNPGQFLQGAVGWATQTLFPPELQTWFLGTIGYPGRHWDSTQIFQVLFRAMQAPALVVAATAASARILRSTLDHRVAAMHACLDVLPRFLLAVALIGVPGTTVSAGYTIIVWAVDASVALSSFLFLAILHASLLEGVKPGQGWFSQVVIQIINRGHSSLAVIIGAVPLLIMVLYAVCLLILRTVMLGFCIATGPLCVATLAFDARNRFFQWWFDLLVGALMTPIVFAVAIPLSIALASSVVAALVVGPILAFVVMCGGLWFSGKLVHQMTWRHFSHGGALAGFAAGVSTMLGPVHRLANAGFMAEALGANAGGDNGAVNFMKRLGLAAQGYGGGGAVGSGLLAAAGTAAASMDAPNVQASGGAPDMVQSLSPAGRMAVGGAEQVFSQRAFSAFAHSQARAIGTLTRDHPFGSISAGDRARLAWERTPPRQRAAFADDFLATWLGRPESAGAAAQAGQPVVPLAAVADA